MVERIKYRDLRNHDIFHSDRCKVKHLQFTVVNNPQPEQFFEDYKMRDMSTNDEVPIIRIPDDPDQSMSPDPETEIDIIFTPDYLYSYIRSPKDFKTNGKVVVRPTNPIYSRTMSGNENVAYSRMQRQGVKMLYINQYAIFLSDNAVDGIIYAADHITEISYYDKDESFSSIWRNITWQPEATVRITAKSDYEMLSIAPYITNQRHNPDLTPLHKFDEYILRKGETINTTVFDDSTYSLLHVGKGIAQINGVPVQRYEFYEHDATTAIAITAIEDCIVVQTSKVPTIDFTGLIE